MAELDAQTVKEFQAAEAKAQRAHIERAINEKAGREFTDAERDAAMKDLVGVLRDWALKSK